MPDSENRSGQRRAWRIMAAVGCILGAANLVFAASANNARDEATDRATKAICAVLVYSEQAATSAKNMPVPKNLTAAEVKRRLDAVARLERLGTEMRGTGVDCPPRKTGPFE